MSDFQEGEAFIPLCLIIQLTVTTLYLLGLYFLNRRSHRTLKAVSVQKVARGKEESFTDVDMRSVDNLEKIERKAEPSQFSKMKRPVVQTDQKISMQTRDLVKFKEATSFMTTFTPKPPRSEASQIVYRRAASFEMNRKTVPHFSFHQLTIDQDRANQEEENPNKLLTSNSPSLTNSPTPCTTPQMMSVQESTGFTHHESKVVKKNRVILEEEIAKNNEGRESISGFIEEPITKIKQEIKSEGHIIQQPSKEPSKSQIKTYVDLLETKERQSPEPPLPRKKKTTKTQQPKYMRYLAKDDRIGIQNESHQNCCSRGFKQFNTLIRLICAKSKDVKISKKSSFTMVYCILSFNMLLTGLHTKIVYYNHEDNSISQINLASMGSILLESVILFCSIKIPFECMLNRRRRTPPLEQPTIEFMSQQGVPSFQIGKSKPKKPHCCTAKRVTFILILVLSIISLGGILALQVIFYLKLSVIWLCLFTIGFLFYFTIFEGVITLFILCFEKDCQRLCGGCLQSKEEAVPYRAQL